MIKLVSPLRLCTELVIEETCSSQKLRKCTDAVSEHVTYRWINSSETCKVIYRDITPVLKGKNKVFIQNNIIWSMKKLVEISWLAIMTVRSVSTGKKSGHHWRSCRCCHRWYGVVYEIKRFLAVWNRAPHIQHVVEHIEKNEQSCMKRYLPNFGEIIIFLIFLENKPSQSVHTDTNKTTAKNPGARMLRQRFCCNLWYVCWLGKTRHGWKYSVD